MKIQTLIKVVLPMMALVFLGSRQAAGQGWAINVVSLDAVTKVEQRHNPGVGPNYLVLAIEGKSGGKPMSISISFNTTGWGAQKLFDSCEKNALLAMHYPAKYVFEIMSQDTGQDGNVQLDVSSSTSDAVMCSVKTRSMMIDPKLPSTQLPATQLFK